MSFRSDVPGEESNSVPKVTELVIFMKRINCQIFAQVESSEDRETGATVLEVENRKRGALQI